MLRKLKGTFVGLLLSSFVFVGFTQSVQAAIIGTEQIAAAHVSQQNREKIAATLDHPEVIAQLERFGVDKKEAEARVAALTDAEAAALAGEIDKMPAGGSSGWEWVGWLLVIFLILVLTDYLGWTHIFPWTKARTQTQTPTKTGG
jgi:hypothetical protein